MNLRKRTAQTMLDIDNAGKAMVDCLQAMVNQRDPYVVACAREGVPAGVAGSMMEAELHMQADYFAGHALRMGELLPGYGAQNRARG